MPHTFFIIVITAIYFLLSYIFSGQIFTTQYMPWIANDLPVIYWGFSSYFQFAAWSVTQGQRDASSMSASVAVLYTRQRGCQNTCQTTHRFSHHKVRFFVFSLAELWALKIKLLILTWTFRILELPRLLFYCYATHFNCNN